MTAYIFIPNWGLMLLAGVSLGLAVALLFLSKRLEVLEAAANDLQEHNTKLQAALSEDL